MDRGILVILNAVNETTREVSIEQLTEQFISVVQSRCQPVWEFFLHCAFRNRRTNRRVFNFYICALSSPTQRALTSGTGSRSDQNLRLSDSRTCNHNEEISFSKRQNRRNRRSSAIAYRRGTNTSWSLAAEMSIHGRTHQTLAKKRIHFLNARLAQETTEHSATHWHCMSSARTASPDTSQTGSASSPSSAHQGPNSSFLARMAQKSPRLHAKRSAVSTILTADSSSIRFEAPNQRQGSRCTLMTSTGNRVRNRNEGMDAYFGMASTEYTAADDRCEYEMKIRRTRNLALLMKMLPL